MRRREFITLSSGRAARVRTRASIDFHPSFAYCSRGLARILVYKSQKLGY
jgi:hypothetical protein